MSEPRVVRLADWRHEVGQGDTTLGFDEWCRSQDEARLKARLSDRQATAHIVVIVDGGLVQEVIANMPVKVMIVDHDTEGSADELTEIDGERVCASVWLAGFAVRRANEPDGAHGDETARVHAIFDKVE